MPNPGDHSTLSIFFHVRFHVGFQSIRTSLVPWSPGPLGPQAQVYSGPLSMTEEKSSLSAFHGSETNKDPNLHIRHWMSNIRQNKVELKHRSIPRKVPQ